MRPLLRKRLRLEVLVEVARADTEVLADADRGQRAGADEAVHGHRRHPHRIGDFANREQSCWSFAHGRHL